VLSQETSPHSQSLGDTYIPGDYFKFIEMAGARAVPIM